jgi:hypothetical protein
MLVKKKCSIHGSIFELYAKYTKTDKPSGKIIYKYEYGTLKPAKSF